MNQGPASNWSLRPAPLCISACCMSDDSPQFRDLVGKVTPIKREQTTEQRRRRQTSPGLLQRRVAAQQDVEQQRNGLASQDHIPPVKPHDVLSFKRDGVQHGVFKNLRLGKYQIDARLDLHRHTVDQARRAVFEFVRDCMALDIRCALIAHGKGDMRDKPALLKSCVNHWLKELDEVLAFHSAQPFHGGTGATYVMLRKSSKDRDENREWHQTKRKGV